MTAYYNEIDPFAADWLRELIKARLIAPGEVDTRSIEDVVPTDLRGFTQCHFFAGIGVWSHALRCARWPDDRPVWTGSCPCQPFSTAGKGDGFADERHLWPAFFHLINQCHPVTVIGEQVASNHGRAWLDLVSADLEGVGYTCGAIDTCAAGFGAPHIRQRLYWMASYGMAQPHSQRWRRRSNRPHQGNGESLCQGDIAKVEVERPSALSGLGNPPAGGFAENQTISQFPTAECGVSGSLGRMADTMCQQNRKEQQRPSTTERERVSELSGGCDTSHRLADTNTDRPQGRLPGRENPQREALDRQAGRGSADSRPSPTNGFWDSVDWLLCRDGKWRPVESLPEPLADGIAHKLGYSRIEGRYSLNPLQEKAENRVMRLRGYGNAIVAPQAEAFIRACMEVV